MSSEVISVIAEKVQDIFNKLGKGYSSAIPLIDSDSLPDHPPHLPSIRQIKKILKCLKREKGRGTVNISTWILINLAKEQAVVVHDIMCSSITERKCPTLYKHVLISPVPIFHPPENNEMDFRQILVLSSLGKVLEKIQVFLNKDAPRVKGNQHAFLQG